MFISGVISSKGLVEPQRRCVAQLRSVELAQIPQHIKDAWIIRAGLRFVVGQSAWVGLRYFTRISRGQVWHIDRLDRRSWAGQVGAGIYGKRHNQSSMVSVCAEFLVHRRCDKRLTSLFRRHLPLHCQTTAASGVCRNLVARANDVSAQNLEALERATDLPLDAATKSDGNRLPLNFSWVADFIRVHFAPPRVVPGRKLQISHFVPSGCCP